MQILQKNIWNNNSVWSWLHLLIILILFDDHHIITWPVFCILSEVHTVLQRLVFVNKCIYNQIILECFFNKLLLKFPEA